MSSKKPTAKSPVSEVELQKRLNVAVSAMDALQAQIDGAEPPTAVKAALRVQRKLAESVREILADGRTTIRAPKVTVSLAAAEPVHNIKLLLNSQVELEVSGDLKLLFTIIDRYAGQERRPLDLKRYGINKGAKPAFLPTIENREQLDSLLQS